MFPTILEIKNTDKVQTKFFHQNSTKTRTIHFNISVAVKHGGDNNKQMK